MGSPYEGCRSRSARERFAVVVIPVTAGTVGLPVVKIARRGSPNWNAGFSQSVDWENQR